MGKKKKRRKALQEAQSSGEETAAAEISAGRKKKKRKKVPQVREHPNWLLTGLACAGMALTAYLAVTKLLNQPPLYCGEGSSCDIVQQSRWGTFLSMPTAFWGFLTYTALACIGIWVRNIAVHWKGAWTVSLAGLGYSAYLISVSLFVIEAACGYCIASFLIMAVIFGVLTFQRPKELPEFKFASWAGQSVIITLLIVGGMHLHYSGVFDPAAGPEDPFLQGLAEHLARDKALMYGAYW